MDAQKRTTAVRVPAIELETDMLQDTGHEGDTVPIILDNDRDVTPLESGHKAAAIDGQPMPEWTGSERTPSTAP